MKMKLISLVLENFKCHEHLEMHFDGRSADIYGQNAAGKSSIYDGITWLLFGKDSHGRKDFDIKPLTQEGNVKDHSAITSVEAVLRADDTTYTLKRTYYEVWSTKRGSAESTFDGHSSDYFIDDVPLKKNEFVRRVGEIIDENVFRLLTGITYFASELPWQERRAILFGVAEVATDEEILLSDARFEPLSEAMQGLTLDDYRKKLTAQRKGLNKVRTDVPARLDECKKTVADLSKVDFPALEQRRAEAQKHRTAVQHELDESQHDGGAAALRNKLDGIRNELGQLENENTAYRMKQQTEIGQDESAALRQERNAITARESRRQRDLTYLNGRQTALEGDITACRKLWDSIHKETFQGGICPTCGQPLPKDKLDASKAAFEADKERRKSDAVHSANRAKEALAGVREDIAKLEQGSAEDLKQIESLDERLRALESAPRREINDIDGYAVRKAELDAQAADTQKELDTLSAGADAHRKALRDTLAGIDEELDRLGGELAKKTALDYATGRMDELRAQAAAATDELNGIDQMLFLCDEFVRYKVKFVEDSINRRFALVRFRLFREQINGGLEDCCDVTVKGVPYSSGLNEGAKVNAGIDIINTLSRHYDAQVPLFVDKAESVTGLLEADTQVIRLVVSKSDKELRCELQ